MKISRSWKALVPDTNFGKWCANPILLQVVRQVGNHDLGLGGDAVLGRTALLALARLTRLTGSSIFLVALLSCKRFVRSFGEGSDLAGYICGCALGGGGVGELDLLGLGTFSLGMC